MSRMVRGWGQQYIMQQAGIGMSDRDSNAIIEALSVE